MNSYQIYNLIKEIQLIKESRINNISLCEDYSILIELYSASIKKKYLHIKVPNFLFLRNEKCDIIQANSFTKTLREKLLGSIIKEIIQCGADRIIEFKLSNDKKLIIELFLRGNIIILDNDNKIELIMDKKKFENKKSNIGEEYNIVNPAFEYKKITYEKINKLIENNKGDTIGLFIATKLNLAKEISEFLCNELNFDKNKFMNELKKEEKENLIKKIKEILKIKPSININKNSLLTIPDNNKSQFDTISEGFKKINEQLKEKITNTKYTNQINKIKNIIKKQNKLLEINKKKEEEYNLVANKLYENFENNEAILNKIKDDNKIIENNTFIKKNNILKINKKNKTLIIKIQ